ncbi:hypothetical protein C8N46_101738 [Kordia periserrulae]|uniref:Outer membrane protein with beta-barrel domain n=1 Tax=Kordia periserrulae TaxID=701523 RepID=A0A2T6C748_9FLAO|nr:hypothetical protein [Kordia periserrulae]PTX64127.1 hypothetical protein C8N46_101738 [Kordia periserrulae]
MKKITFFACVFAMMCLHAQNDDTASSTLNFAKGTQFLNINFSLTTGNTDVEAPTQNQEIKNFGISFNPSYSYAVSDNLFLGLGAGIGFNSRDIELNGMDAGENTTNSFSIFPFVRYYKGVGKRFGFFLQGETRYRHSKAEVDNANPRKTNTFFVGVRPGIVFMLSDNFGLEATFGDLGYTSSNVDDEATGTETDFNNFGLSLNSTNLFFGLSYYF